MTPRDGTYSVNQVARQLRLPVPATITQLEKLGVVDIHKGSDRLERVFAEAFIAHTTVTRHAGPTR